MCSYLCIKLNFSQIFQHTEVAMFGGKRVTNNLVKLYWDICGK